VAKSLTVDERAARSNVLRDDAFGGGLGAGDPGEASVLSTTWARSDDSREAQPGSPAVTTKLFLEAVKALTARELAAGVAAEPARTERLRRRAVVQASVLRLGLRRR
jgi:hypothetical protein